jgi:hypothetical protein
MFLDAAAVVSPLLRSPELAARWAAPSALDDFRVSGLAGHLGRAVFTVERHLDTPMVAGLPRVDAVSYYALTFDDGPDDPVRRRIRDRGEEDAGTGPTDLAERFDAARSRLAPRLSSLPADHPVVVFDRWQLRLDECLLTRLLELVVHLDDLAVSLDVPTPAVSAAAADAVITTLARIAMARHGATALTRALARHERAPSSVSAF